METTLLYCCSSVTTMWIRLFFRSSHMFLSYDIQHQIYKKNLYPSIKGKYAFTASILQIIVSHNHYINEYQRSRYRHNNTDSVNTIRYENTDSTVYTKTALT